jgi:hypothetical protein
MSSPIISVKNIGKKYKLGATLGGRNYKTLRDTIANGVKAQRAWREMQGYLQERICPLRLALCPPTGA